MRCSEGSKINLNMSPFLTGLLLLRCGLENVKVCLFKMTTVMLILYQLLSSNVSSGDEIVMDICVEYCKYAPSYVWCFYDTIT